MAIKQAVRDFMTDISGLCAVLATGVFAATEEKAAFMVSLFFAVLMAVVQFLPEKKPVTGQND